MASTPDSSYFVVYHGEAYEPAKFERETEGPGAYNHKLVLYNSALKPMWKSSYIGRWVEISNDGQRVMVLNQHPSYSPGQLKSYKTGPYIVVLNKSGEVIFKKNSFENPSLLEIAGATLSPNGRYLLYLIEQNKPINIIDLNQNRRKKITPQQVDDIHKSCRPTGAMTLSNSLNLTATVHCRGGRYTWKYKINW